VAELRPNDLGFFDTLGNLQEWCERVEALGHDHPAQRTDLRGGWCSMNPPNLVSLSFAVFKAAMGRQESPFQGFRVVRTVPAR
jgi:formylglycine-generating enzyme required for sulfatase activity